MQIDIESIYSFQQMGERTNQEDSRYPDEDAPDTSHAAFAVCDGVGGNAKGEVASSTVCWQIGQSMSAHTSRSAFDDKDFQDVLARSYKALDNASNASNRGMGTTLTFLCFHPNGAYAAHIGDSRIYQIRPNEGIIYRSEDHSLVNALLRSGNISPEQAKDHPRKNVITRCMNANDGTREKDDASVIHLQDVVSGDYFLLCTDGVTACVEDEDLIDLYSSDKSDKEKNDWLAKQCANSPDNNTAIQIHVGMVTIDVEDAPSDDECIPEVEDTKTIPLEYADEIVHEVSPNSNTVQSKIKSFLKNIFNMKTLLIVAATFFFAASPYSSNAQKRTKTKQNSVEKRTQEIRDSLNAIMDKAKAGDADAMNEVGTWYYTGKHVNKDFAQAYEWWKKSALKSNVRAIANLGLCYQLGNGVAKDSIGAMRLYKKSIKEGNTSLLKQRVESAGKHAFDAMLAGECYEVGIGTAKNYAKAAELYALSANKGSVDGMRQAGICYLNAKNNVKALEYFEKGANAGDLPCEYWAGKMLLGDMNVPANKQQAVVYLLKAAEGGMAAAQNEMGSLYTTGNGVTKNLTQAADWYYKAATQGFAASMWNYGCMLKDGQGVNRDYDQALFWMAEAEANGYRRSFSKMVSELDSIGTDPFLNYVYGMRLYLLDGKMKEANAHFKKVEKAKIDEGKIMQAVILASKRNEKPNAKKAAQILDKLSSTNQEASFYLATLYETGNGVKQDMEKAISLYKLSADMGYGKAQCYLADIYYEGRGTDKNLTTAVELYQKAMSLRQLSNNGAIRLAECYENGEGGLTVDKKKAEQLRNNKYGDKLPSLLKTINAK